MKHPNPRRYIQSSLDGAHSPGAANTPPVFSEPFPQPSNHAQEIANVIAWRDWYKAQKGITE